jgi:hypothetical protein
MAFQRMGYIGKSFTMGALGILGTLVACGGGGITSTIAQAVASPYVLFASGYKSLSSAANDLKAQTFEGGYVYAGSGGNFIYLGSDQGGYSNGTWTDNDMMARQAFGISWKQNAATPTDASFAYQAIKAPKNLTVDASQSTKIVIQMGNGTSNQWDANAKKVFRVQLDGGIQNTSNWSYPQSCSYDKTLAPAAISDSGLGGSNNYGLRTYEIDLSAFTCSQGDLATLKKDIKQVTVKLVGGIDAATDATSGAYTMMQTGLIAFSKD